MTNEQAKKAALGAYGVGLVFGALFGFGVGMLIMVLLSWGCR